jgi:hypothetical protein
MATNTIKMIFQFRRDTAENWLLNKDVVPAAGEPCFVIDENVLKIGDGVTTFENLKAIGGTGISVAVDGKSIAFENDVFKLMGFDAAEVGAQPRKNADGKLEWVVPSTETVEGLQTTVSGMQSDIAALKRAVGTTVEGEDTLAARVETLEEQMEVLNGDETVEGSIDKKVADKVTAEINAFATKMNENDIVDTFKELVDYVADHGAEVSGMLSDIEGLQTAVAGKVDAEEGKSLISDTLIAKLEAMEEGVQGGKIEAINLGDTALEIDENKTVTIPVGAGLKASDEIIIAEDGSLKIGAVGFSKLIDDDVTISLDGGTSSDI